MQPAGSDRRPRAPAQRLHGGQRPLRPQAGRPRHRRHGLPRRRTATKIYVIANPGEGLTSLAYTQPERHAAEGRSATTTRRVRVREAVLEQLVPARELPVEPALRQLLGPLAVGRKRPHQPERRPPVRLPGDDVRPARRQPAFGPLATDRPHQFKTQFIYQFPFGTSFGVNQYIASGLPVIARNRHLPRQQLPGPVPGPRQRRPDADMFSQTDIYRAAPFRFGWRPAACSSASTCSTCSTRTPRSRSSRPTRGRRPVDRRNGVLHGSADFAQLITQPGHRARIRAS